MRTIVRNMVIGAALAPIVAWGAPAAGVPPTTKLADNFFAAAEKTVRKGAKARLAKTIKLKDNFFAPSKKTVRRGTTVRFKWAGINAHNVVKASGPGGRFASRTTWRRGVNFAKKFRKTGTYRLVCTLHSGMELELKVVPRPRSARRPFRQI